MQKLRKKIVIIGVSASGKSTLARKLSEALKLPLILVDTIMWRPGWDYIGDEETAKRLDEVSATEEWIIEGYITKQARSFVFERADTIIYLDYPSWVNARRYVTRWWKHRKYPRPELEGSPDKFSFKFLKLVWTKGEAISLRRFLSQVAKQEKIIILHSPKETGLFLQKLG